MLIRLKKIKSGFRLNSTLVRLISLLIIASIFYSCLENNTDLHPEKKKIKIKGFSYTSFTNFGYVRGNSINAIEDLIYQTNSEWISLCFFEYQDNPNSTEIAPNTTGVNPLDGKEWSLTSTLYDIKEAIRRAKQNKMKVMLKPHVDLYSGEWRAAITPDDNGLWFKSYSDMMLKYANLAKEEKVDMLCIGVEYIVATQKKYSDKWSELIDKIKKEYSGKLIYAASFGSATMFGISSEEYEQIEFWDELDYIGIDFYTSIIDDVNSPFAYENAMLMMNQLVKPIEKISNKYTRNIILTEVGIQSVKGALQKPWDYQLGSQPNAIVDDEGQKFYYNIMLNSFSQQLWFDGFFWWNWESTISENEKTNYTPRNKPAAELIKSWYTF
ncbi:MAG: hypothetical protein EPN82_08490 [Bacteroidetes bacterium]|nr:MAG: hypothetical protein EPN82_08490 [Bacteroidota bacterium]